ncbi:MAG: peptidylprolyl isomerase [Gammaproteobacteria bacterium]|nr:peptidylprolyl isomerase [Gammaproteobacteria bacterium]
MVLTSYFTKYKPTRADKYLLFVALLGAANAFAGDVQPVKAANQAHVPHAMYFAMVNGQEISIKEFQTAFKAGVNKRFYHGKIPEAELQVFKKEVSQTLVDRVLLLSEARRQNITADVKSVNDKLAEYEKRYAGRPFWANNKASVIPGLRGALEEQSVLTSFENKVKALDLPAMSEAESFYKKNPALFTTPEKLHVSLVLLKVAPSSPAAVWDAARKEAEDLIARVKKGADFSQMARIHSGDASAAKGGDMGFIHKGMLAKPAQVAIDEMHAGEISQPIMMLKGVAIIRLEEKQAATLNAFEKVSERAQKLLQRESSELAWTDLLEKLRSQADIKINTIALGI